MAVGSITECLLVEFDIDKHIVNLFILDIFLVIDYPTNILKNIDMNKKTFPINTVEFAKALADDTRQKIMALCCCRWISVTEIVDQLNVAQPTVSHHLKILKQAGLVKSERKGKQVLYSLNQERLAKGCCQVAENFAPDQRIELREENPG